MKIIKVVLTGGPCAGKTTALKSIRKNLEEREIPIITVSETATEMILNGITSKKAPVYYFQQLVLKQQLTKEEIAYEYAKEVYKDSDICVIIYDRGIIDNKVYLDSFKDFKKLLGERNLKEIQILDSYDLAIDMLSLATCKPEKYNLLNEARFENPEEAAQKDKTNTLAWITHRNFKIVTSDMSKEEEIKIVMNYIDDLIKGFEKKQIRRFIVDTNESNLNIYNENNSQEMYITDYYLEHENNNYNYVVSKREYNDDISYIYKVYKEVNGNITTIEDRMLTQEQYDIIITNSKITKEIERKELYFIYNNQKYILCFYEDYTTLEIEESIPKKEILIPENISIIDEITNNLDIKINPKKKVKGKG